VGGGAWGGGPLGARGNPGGGGGGGGWGWGGGGGFGGPIGEQGEKEKEGTPRRFLLLEWRTAEAPERTAVARDGRDPNRVRRSRGRVLDNSLGRRPRGQRPDVRCLCARRSWGFEHPRRT